MSFSAWAAFAAYCATLVGALILARRSTNWRIRLLAYTVSLFPLCRLAAILSNNHIWTREVGDIAETLELLVAALCLTSIYLLDRENRDRRNTDARLRLNEVIQGAKRRLRAVGQGGSLDWTADRRKEPRLAARIGVTVSTPRSASQSATQGCVIDISGSGVGVEIKTPIAVGSAVRIDGEGILIYGKVRRCDATSGGEHVVGIQVSEWVSLPEVVEAYHCALYGEEAGAQDPAEAGAEQAKVIR